MPRAGGVNAKTIYISDSIWRNLPRETRKDLLKVFQRDRYVGRYASNAERGLRAIGEHELAARLLEDLQDLPQPLRARPRSAANG